MKLNRFFIGCAVLLLLVSTAGAESESLASIFTNAATRPAAIPRRSAVIYIALNGLACGDLSCYGQKHFQTPNIDRLAAEGMRFTNYRAGGDDLAQAQVELLGGKAAFTPGETSLAVRLHQAGYFTGMFGEWAIGSPPWTLGFDDFGGFLNEQEARNYYGESIWRLFHGAVEREQIYENSGGQHGQFLPDLMLTAAGNFARTHAPGFGNRYRPFFLLLTLPAPQSLTPGKDDYPMPTDAPFSGEKWPQAAKNRAALLTRLDTDIGALLDQISKSGMSNNVAIFLTGAAAPEKFAQTNMNFLMLSGEVRGGDSPERLRVPLIVRWPGHVPAGRVNDASWSAADFAPTALEMAYAKPATNFAGVSMLPVLTGRPGTNSAAPPRAGRP